MNVLVTGGAGFIGSTIVKYLLENTDAFIVVVDDLSTGSLVNLPMDPRVKFIKDSICTVDFNTLLRDGKFHSVYHMAAVVGVKRVLRDPLGTIEINVTGTHRLLDAIVALPEDSMPRLFFASTSEVYGKNDKHTLSEMDDRIVGTTPRARWVYSDTKAMDEFVITQYGKKYGLQAVIARFFSIAGPKQVSQYGMVIPAFVKAAIKGEDITVYGDGTQIRSFMHVDDCVRSIIYLMGDEGYAPVLRMGCEVINIGHPDPIMIKDLAWRVRHFAGAKSKIVYKSYEEAYGEGFEDMVHRVPCIDKLSGILDTTSFKDLDQIIMDTVSYYRALESQ